MNETMQLQKRELELKAHHDRQMLELEQQKNMLHVNAEEQYNNNERELENIEATLLVDQSASYSKFPELPITSRDGKLINDRSGMQVLIYPCSKLMQNKG